jgi:integrase
MASRYTAPNGDTWIFVKAANKKRRPVRLGSQTRHDAEEAERRVETIERCFHRGGDLDPMTRMWVQQLPAVLHDRLARTGLLPEDLVDRERSTPTYAAPAAPVTPPVRDCSLDRLVTRWQETVAQVEPQTVGNYDREVDRLRRFVSWLDLIDEQEAEQNGGKPRKRMKDIRHLVAADGARFPGWMEKHGRVKGDKALSKSTISRSVGTIQRIVEHAVLEEWILKNPFGHLTRQGEFNEDRHVYVTARLIDHLIEISGDDELAAMLALSRYASYRGPSEFKSLCWIDVDWENAMIAITASKTKRYRNGKRRRAPLNERCIKLLNRLWDRAGESQDKVFPRLGDLDSSQLSERVEILCRRTGVALWEKPWINLRASCETDWQQIDKMQPFETAAYMGHSATVALLHYNRVAKDRVADLPADLIQDEAKQTKRGSSDRSTNRSTRISSRISSH